MVHRHFGGVERSAKREQAGAADQILQVRAGESVGAPCQAVEIDVLGERHFRGVNSEDATAAAFVRHRHVDQFVEAAGAEQGRIDQVRPVGGADYDDRLQFLEAVHLGENG